MQLTKRARAALELTPPSSPTSFLSALFLTIALVLATNGMSWSATLHAGEDTEAAIDAFFATESEKIAKARANIEAHMNKRMQFFHDAKTKKYMRTFTPLHIAAQDGDLAEVQALIRMGRDVNSVTESGGTPLNMATKFNRLDVMRCLLENGADPDAGNSPPLWEAAFFKRLSAIKLLLEYGANPNQKNSAGGTPLDGIFFRLGLIPHKRTMDALQLLLNAGANPNVSAPYFFIWVKEIPGAERLLLDSGAKQPDVKFRDDSELPELHRAAKRGDLATVIKLVQDGADVNDSGGIRFLPAVNYAAEAGQLTVLKWLAEHGADLSARTQLLTDDIFLSAVQGDNKEVMRICLENGIPVDYQTTRYEMTPLALAATGALSSRDWNTAAFLIENGADVNWKNDTGMTPLHLTASMPLWDFDKIGMENLIAAGADVEALDNDGLSPMHYAAARNNRRAMAVMMRAR